MLYFTIYMILGIVYWALPKIKLNILKKILDLVFCIPLTVMGICVIIFYVIRNRQ